MYIAVSVDGFIARSDGRIDWLSVVEKKGEDYGYARFFESIMNPPFVESLAPRARAFV